MRNNLGRLKLGTIQRDANVGEIISAIVTLLVRYIRTRDLKICYPFASSQYRILGGWGHGSFSVELVERLRRMLATIPFCEKYPCRTALRVVDKISLKA